MTRVLVAPDKFKGSLTAAEAADALAAGLTSADPELRVATAPVADGGDGTVAAAIAAGWQPVTVDTTGPTGLPVTAVYAVRGRCAVIELASAAGLGRLPGGALDPLNTTTYGVGTVIAHALDHGRTDVIVGLGGSASTDGGAGLLQALGAVITGAGGKPVGRGGGALAEACRLDLEGLHPRVRSARFRVACDVDNPLLGPRGAAAVYGPQKGATTADVRLLERALTRWAEVVADATGRPKENRSSAEEAGTGAAGGTSFGMMTVLGSKITPGAALVLELTGFDARLDGVDLVVTGEGALDAQSLAGKAPVGVAQAAGRRGIPVVAVAGRCGLDREQLDRAGIAAVYSLTDLEPDPAVAMADAARLLRRLGARIAAEHGRVTEPARRDPVK